jgi:hypothetical protein
MTEAPQEEDNEFRNHRLNLNSEVGTTPQQFGKVS